MKSDEKQLTLALQAIQKDPALSLRKAAKIFLVDPTALSQRKRGRQSRRDKMPNSRKLTDLEERAIVQRVIDLDSQAFPPRFSGVEDMANRLLRDRGAKPVGKHWVSNFIQRQPELKTMYSRKYDYQRALCEDPRSLRSGSTLYGTLQPNMGSKRRTYTTSMKQGF